MEEEGFGNLKKGTGWLRGGEIIRRLKRFEKHLRKGQIKPGGESRVYQVEVDTVKLTEHNRARRGGERRKKSRFKCQHPLQ